MGPVCSQGPSSPETKAYKCLLMSRSQIQVFVSRLSYKIPGIVKIQWIFNYLNYYIKRHTTSKQFPKFEHSSQCVLYCYRFFKNINSHCILWPSLICYLLTYKSLHDLALLSFSNLTVYHFLTLQSVIYSYPESFRSWFFSGFLTSEYIYSGACFCLQYDTHNVA